MNLRRVAAEALTKQRILEAELEAVMGVLKRVVPQDYDLSGLLNRFSLLEDMNNLSIEEEPKRQ